MFLVYYSPAFLRNCCAGAAEGGALKGLVALSEVYRAARRLWPRDLESEADGVTIYVDELKGCASVEEVLPVCRRAYAAPRAATPLASAVAPPRRPPGLHERHTDSVCCRCSACTQRAAAGCCSERAMLPRSSDASSLCGENAWFRMPRMYMA